VGRGHRCGSLVRREDRRRAGQREPGQSGPVFLNDIAIAQTGALYITIRYSFDDVGNVLHPGPDRIFRIGSDRQ